MNLIKIMTQQLVFTRYLYSVDETIHSLLLCVLEKKSFQKCLFWLSELYYSKFYQLLWDFMWQTYYDFYAITNPKFEKYILKSQKKWIKKNDISHVIDVINVLYYATSISNNVFKMRTKCASMPKTIYKKTPKWILKLNLSRKEQSFIQSLHNKNHRDIQFYFRQIQNNIDRCGLIIKEYVDSTKLIDKNIIDSNIINKNIESNCAFKNTLYNNKRHIVLSIICCLMNDSLKVNNRLIKKKVKPEDVVFVENVNAVSDKIRLTLTEKRKFSIGSQIGFFNNNRIENYSHALWYKWEYYARNCPLWKERFKKYKCSFEKKEPVFPNDDLLEEFYEEFGYEPDEQSKECQMKSLQPLMKVANIGLLEGFKGMYFPRGK